MNTKLTEIDEKEAGETIGKTEILNPRYERRRFAKYIGGGKPWIRNGRWFALREGTETRRLAVCYQYEYEPKKKAFYIAEIRNPGESGKGYGKRLIRALCRRFGNVFLFKNPDEGRKPLRHYRSLGFLEESVLGNRYGRGVNGHTVIRGFMNMKAEPWLKDYMQIFVDSY